MKKQWKNKWIKALRDGSYKQGEGVLRNNENQYCCLGVLCDLVDKNEWKQSKNNYDFYGNNTELPRGIKNILDISYEAEGALITMNDNGKSFNEIADWIQEKL